MTDTALHARLEDLEIRLTHHEAAMDEITRTLLQQERLVAAQADALRRLEAQLRANTAAQIASRDEETPPHY